MNTDMEVMRLEGMEVSVVKEFNDAVEDACAFAELVGGVDDAASNEIAFAASKQLTELIRTVEASRKAIKAPVIALGKKIEAIADKAKEKPMEANLRLNKMMGDYAQLLRAKELAREAAARAELDAIERKKQEELAKATSIEQHQAIKEDYAEKASTVVVHVEPERPKGQVAREDWDIEVNDPYALSRSHPRCVKIIPLLNEIKAILDAGGKPSGVTAKRVMKVHVH